MPTFSKEFNLRYYKNLLEVLPEKEKRKLERLTHWHSWFAWYPVYVKTANNKFQLTWLKKVCRKFVFEMYIPEHTVRIKYVSLEQATIEKLLGDEIKFVSSAQKEFLKLNE